MFSIAVTCLMAATVFRIGRSMPVDTPEAVPAEAAVLQPEAVEQNNGSTMQLTKPDVALRKLLQQTVKASEEMMRGVGRLVLATGESVNFAWDVGVSAVLKLCRMGGDAYNQLAKAIQDVPLLGYGARGIDVALRNMLDAATDSTKQDIEIRHTTYDTLKQKMDENAAVHAAMFA
ncbi:uncharacterized protein LOC126847873 [Adelges cooleyi]|uniref:uncharacterized protein LOC126847767 n=1 Tax=Adelges cooleyi TaxID=133065 RepID=UPI00217F896F|nr:uncharacterized protein LOC126847767 [Adelges cooleyi]XP_050444244.1 uncharacterized protein LOC126847873 [Adelges cooleyi]